MSDVPKPTPSHSSWWRLPRACLAWTSAVLRPFLPRETRRPAGRDDETTEERSSSQRRVYRRAAAPAWFSTRA